MYLVVVLLTMLVLPLASFVIEVATSGGDTLTLLGKWFVVWGVGVRLLLAGVRQVAKPRLTTEMLGIAGTADVVVRELGFANIAFSALGLASLWVPEWMLASALAGAVFYLTIGIQHLLRKPSERDEYVAMVSDLGIAVVLLVVLVGHAV